MMDVLNLSYSSAKIYLAPATLSLELVSMLTSLLLIRAPGKFRNAINFARKLKNS
jgi:hypothetical protein